MKKAISFLFVILLLISLCSCGGPKQENLPEPTSQDAEIPVEPGTLYRATVSALQGGYCTLTMKDAFQVTLDDTFGEKITWTSSDESVATVEDGLILPQGPGKADIVFTDGENSGVTVILVDTTPKDPKPAGQLLIEKDGTLYETSIAGPHWALMNETPRYMESDFVAVYEAEGTYYVKSEFLLNVLCCVFGDCNQFKSPDGGLPQISGNADIKNANPELIYNWFSDNRVLVTTPVMMELPDGSTHGGNLCTQIFENDEQTGIVYYNAIKYDSEFYQNPDIFLAEFGVECSIRYDQQRKALIISL
ncbi:MAG: Ig-like domain-containing protein [Lachnospiraceae bacterium]|nr:Ig-like domain-containing protein [Lachnospiraceae bacterium]